MGKRIELCKKKAGEIKNGFGNPRKISKKKFDELKRSFEELGDFGIFLIDESDNVVGGNQRLKAVLDLYGPDKEIDCKRLVGYTEAELRAINIRDNTHAGEWDLELLAGWTADLNLDLGLQLMNGRNAEERSIKEMELIHYEQYDYVMIVCRDELSFNTLVRNLGIEDAKTLVGPKQRKIKARAIWFDNLAVDLVPREKIEAVREEAPAEGQAPEGNDGV